MVLLKSDGITVLRIGYIHNLINKIRSAGSRVDKKPAKM